MFARQDHLDGHESVQARLSAPVHYTHAAATDFLQEFIFSHPQSGGGGRVQRGIPEEDRAIRIAGLGCVHGQQPGTIQFGETAQVLLGREGAGDGLSVIQIQGDQFVQKNPPF
jgi:hypothetical protein